jgi:hypothetical protein
MSPDFTTIDNQIDSERSRTVKICLVKYKCLLVLIFSTLLVAQTVLVTLGESKTQQLVSRLLNQTLNV